MLYNILGMEQPELIEKKYSILHEISNAIVATDNVNAIANLMLDLAISYTNAEKGSLMLLNEKGELSIFAARGIDPLFMKSYRIKMGEGIAGTVASNREPVLVEDIEKDERFKGKRRDRYKTRSFISCPIVSRQRLLGVININDKKDGSSFTEDEFTLLKTISNQAAIALENAFLMNQIRAKAAELEDMNRKLIETDIVKTEFLTRVSHELRAPLNSIKGAIYYLQQSDKLTRAEQMEFYEIISSETGNLIYNVENLLDFLRLEDEARIIRKSLLDPVVLLKELSDSRQMKSLLTRKNLQLKIEAGEGLSDIVADKIRFMQLFINLIEGVSPFLESGDIISITVSMNDFVKVNLSVPKRLPGTVISYFATAEQILKTDEPEEKLKFYLVKRIAEAHKWDLHAENKDNTFVATLTIPTSAKQKIEMAINTTMDIVVELLSELLDLNICSVMLCDELTGELAIKSARGLDDNTIKSTKIRLGDRIAGWVAMEGKPILIEDIESDPRFGRRNIPQYNTKSLLSVPLKVTDRVIGVINLNNKKTGESFTRRDLYIATALSERISHFIERLYSGEFIESNLKQCTLSFEGLLNAEKMYHKKENIFPDLMMKVMDRLGADEEDKKIALYISIIYDLGLVVIDESIMKRKKLHPSDVRILKAHPYTTVSLLNSFEFSEKVKNAILHHHERYDGKGYPDGLKGEEIPFISRVLSVIDAFCAMTSERPYREAFGKDRALDEIKKGSGSLYDPRIVNALEEIISQIR